MTSGKKSLLTVILSVMMALALVAGCLSMFTGANTAKAESVAPTFETVEGAYVRTHEETERYGIKFQIRMESEEYQTFLSTYTDVEFGMFIIPEDYRTTKGAFTEANLFGGAVYCWDGQVEGKTEILNMAQAEMPEVEDGYNTLYFAITNVQPANVTRPFAGVGYIKYNDGTGVKYVIDDNGAGASRSIAQVAKSAIDSGATLPEGAADVLNSILATKPAVKVAADYNADAISTAVNALEYVDSKKQEIIRIAKEKGYSIEEKLENGKIQLKLIKRIY